MNADPVSILEELVRFRTDRVHGDERKLAEHLGAELRRRGAEDISLVETPRVEGKPVSYVYARFGNPKLIVNAHLDTVPPNSDWHTDPFVPKVDGDRLYALGACDTKGAAAAILAALSEAKPKDIGILFSGDEEYSSVAMRAFLAGPHATGIDRAIVCEPTNLRAGTRHRGFVAFEVRTSGPGGHSSLADHTPAPLAKLARLAVAFTEWGERHVPLGPKGFEGMCLNIAKVDGGIAFNVIPAEGVLTVSFRPPPGTDVTAVYAELEAITRSVIPDATHTWIRQMIPFATRDAAAFRPLLGDAAIDGAIDLGFWTEAALLAGQGIDAVVYGVGDIAHAHAPNEWVPIPELHAAKERFRAIFEAV